jgi:hypothetical protein
MFESIGRSIELFKTSWGILMADKQLLVFPVLSGIISLIVLATFVVPLVIGGALFGTLFFYVALFAFYLVSYFVVIFFNTALISCVNARLQGRSMTIGEGISNALAHVTSILGWALVSATVGVILHLLRERAGIVGQIAAALVGGAWGLVTFFVVPVLVLEDKGVFDAIRESTSLIRKTWGETIIGSGSITLVFFIIVFAGIIAAIAAIFLAAAMKLYSVILLIVALAIILGIILAVIAFAMQGIYVTALYTYAKTGTVPTAFSSDLIQNAFVQK